MGRELNFSERHGYVKISELVQYECMTDGLRTDIFNSIVAYIVIGFCDVEDYNDVPECTLKEAFYAPLYMNSFKRFFKSFYVNILKRRITDIPEYNSIAWKEFEAYFDKAKWHEVYSLVEWFVQKIVRNKEWQEAFHKRINVVLEENYSGYRLLNGLIVPITDAEELSDVQTAMIVDVVSTHLQAALQCLHDKDYRNSVKESISAVEAFVRCKTGKSTLGDALSELEKSDIVIPNVLKQGFQKIYGWTCGEDGIRHAIMDGAQEVTVAEAKFMLVTCSAFINYLKMKGAA